VVLAACAVGAAQARVLDASHPRCFGAADRDPQRPCTNRRLRLVVTPTPDDALLTPNVPCTHESISDVLDQCAFGAAPDQAVETVVLVGDSHAMTWRPALAVVAQARRWRVLEIARPQCPLSRAVPHSTPSLVPGCLEWRREVVAWLAGHPELRTVFVSARARALIEVPKGETDREARLDGYLRAWRDLPPSIAHLIVIRDNPIERLATADCVRRAIRTHRPAGPGCAVRRRWSLRDDLAITAAHRLRARGARVVDLSHHFCSRRRCYPVVGGVLVNRDVDHMTTLFATTLGRFLLRRVDAIVPAALSTARAGYAAFR
jgi:hypothetical protein